jgi:hypothetical protein
MRVECDVEETEIDGDRGPVDGVCVTCSRCDHEVTAFGTTAKSVRRCMVMLREECPNNEENFYTADEAED